MIMVDEISMVSSLTLAYMHLRLEELFGCGKWFGSRNMLFVGDILQLQPVRLPLNHCYSNLGVQDL